jgi:hypothetical protein
MPRGRKKEGSDIMAEEQKEKRPRKSKKEALEAKLVIVETKLEAATKKVEALTTQIAQLKEKIATVGDKELAKNKAKEDKQIAELIRAKGLSLEELQTLLDKE